MAYRGKLQTDIARDIVRDGRCILGVPDGKPAPFAYTIGNGLKGLPELLVIGLARDVGFLNKLSDMMIERGAGFTDGEIVSLGGRLPVKIINANATAQTEYTILASNFHGSDDYSVQQVLLPDKDGHFPDDADCDPRFRMPVLVTRQ